MLAHALLGPSGAKRWMTCTPSARYEEQFDDEDSIYAQEGSQAHELAEAYQKNDQITAHTIRLLGDFYNGEMEEAVWEYLDLSQARYQEARLRDINAVYVAEERYDLRRWIPEGFGTADTTVIGGDLLDLIDLKYGKGVPVNAYDNPQLKLYALGAWDALKDKYPAIKRIRLTISQPRLNSISVYELSLKDLLDWAEYEVKPKAIKAWLGEGVFAPGDHCMFCKGRSRCRALAQYNMDLEAFNYVMPNKLSDEDISNILGKVDRLMSWTKAIKEYALAQALHRGVKWPGFKVVEGTSNRTLKNIRQAMDILRLDGIPEAMLYKPREAIGLTEMENLVGKKKISNLLDHLLTKPQGKPTLVPDIDPRPEFSSLTRAQQEFKKL